MSEQDAIPKTSRRSSLRAEELWTPPQVGEVFQSAFGSSVLEEFVAGHSPCDVLRELVQNEFDAGGTRLEVRFGTDALRVSGNGRVIDKRGWARLRMLLGTGRIIGSDAVNEEIVPKENGIGSKNFGLRSLFLFGDRIYVRSGGKMAVLDLHALGTQQLPKPSSTGKPGVSILVPHRNERFHNLEIFSPEREQAALDDIAQSLLRTVVKLVSPRPGRSIRNVVIASERTGRRLTLQQRANTARCRVKGITAVHRSARVYDDSSVGGVFSPRKMVVAEIEFQRAIDIPPQYQETVFPRYFRFKRKQLRIAISLPLKGTRVDVEQLGRFYYPLGLDNCLTGTTVSISAPFQPDADRSNLIQSDWNRWLVQQAVQLTLDLLVGDWLDRFGADAYRAFRIRDGASPTWFATDLEHRLQTGAWWPTAARVDGAIRFCEAKKIVVPDNESLDGFLNDQTRLDARLANVKETTSMVRNFGALKFSLNSFVRLRCAPENATQLQTKLNNSEANCYYADYQGSMRGLDLQLRMASTLTELSRQLSNSNRRDLRETSSTLAADGQLRAASALYCIDQIIWNNCPVPDSQRLDPRLRQFKVIARLCGDFAIDDWVRKVAKRARAGAVSTEERSSLFEYLLSRGAELKQAVISEIRSSLVVQDHRGDWVAPQALVSSRAAHFHALEPVLSAPNERLEGAPELLRRLRIRQRINGQDLVKYAERIGENPALAEPFEKTLRRISPLLTPQTVKQLRGIPFLMGQNGQPAAPEHLHQRTRLNLACLDPEDGIVRGNSASLYRRLGCLARPSSKTLLASLARHRERGAGQNSPEIFYHVLAETLRQEHVVASLKDQLILWVDGAYHAPEATLVGPKFPRCFFSAVPQVRSPEVLWKAYESLGGCQQPTSRHWRELLLWIGRRYETPGAVLPAEERTALRTAYAKLRESGLPDGIPETTRCLLSQEGTVHSVTELRDGSYTENDHPELAAGVRTCGVPVAFAEVAAPSSSFFVAIRLRPLTSLIEATSVQIGNGESSTTWPRGIDESRALAKLHRQEFISALFELAATHKRRSGQPLALPTRLTVQSRLQSISRISFVHDLHRVYRIAGRDITVPAEVSVFDGRLVMVAPRSRHELEELTAYGLAEILGANTDDQIRALGVIVLPLIQCHSIREMSACLRRQGIDWKLAARYTDPGHEEDDLGGDVVTGDNGIAHELFTQIIADLNAATESSNTPPANPVVSISSEVDRTADAPAPTLTLPVLSEVSVSLADRSTSWTTSPPRKSGQRGVPFWSAPRTTDVERDQLIGQRGEEIVYRRELERVAAMGYERPEDFVVWASRENPTADYDISSIGEDGRPLWIEVKSTTGTDGHFYWPKQEFEKALRERDRYELWRVYEAHTIHPTIKRFRDPISLFQAAGLRLELGTLRAVVEPMHAVDQVGSAKTAATEASCK